MWCQAHSTGLQMHCISLNLVGVNWNQSCSRYHRHVSKYYPINFCLFQILCDSWQWKTKSGMEKWSYVPSPLLCTQKDVCVWIWPMSAHTDMCMDKHKIDVRALPIFRRRTGRHVQGHTHIPFILRQLPFYSFTSTEGQTGLSQWDRTF